MKWTEQELLSQRMGFIKELVDLMDEEQREIEKQSKKYARK